MVELIWEGMKTTLVFIGGFIGGIVAGVALMIGFLMIIDTSPTAKMDEDCLEVDSIDMKRMTIEEYHQEMNKGAYGDLSFGEGERMMQIVNLQNHDVKQDVIDHWDSITDAEKVKALLDSTYKYEYILLEREMNKRK